jgi:hypothetical protein
MQAFEESSGSSYSEGGSEGESGGERERGRGRKGEREKWMGREKCFVVRPLRRTSACRQAILSA